MKIWFLIMTLIGMASMVCLSQSVDVASPSGDITTRVIDWKFPCTSNGKFQLEIRSPAGLELITPLRDARGRDGWCRFPSVWQESHRVTRGYLELGVWYTWRVRVEGGNWLAPARFRTLPIAAYSFDRMPQDSISSDDTWRVRNGWLENATSNGRAWFLTNVDPNSLPGDGPVRRTDYYPTDTVWKVEAVCPEQTCSIALVFAAQQMFCRQEMGERVCARPDWYEFRLPYAGHPSLVKVGNGAEYVVETFPDMYVDISFPQEIRITRNQNEFLITLSDEQRVCVRVDRHSSFGMQTGVIWVSNEDDDGKNSLRVDRLVVAAVPDPVTCDAPLPKL